MFRATRPKAAWRDAAASGEPHRAPKLNEFKSGVLGGEIEAALESGGVKCRVLTGRSPEKLPATECRIFAAPGPPEATSGSAARRELRGALQASARNLRVALALFCRATAACFMRRLLLRLRAEGTVERGRGRPCVALGKLCGPLRRTTYRAPVTEGAFSQRSD